jgi:hypothetical protein
MMGEERNRSILVRLERLEKANLAMSSECRRWRIAGGGLLMAAVVFGIAGASSSDRAPSKLEAQSFILKDPQGRTRASLGFRSDGTPGFALLDAASHVRLALDIGPDGAPGVNLYSPTGRLQAALAVRPDGAPALGLFDGQAQVRVSLDLSHDEKAPGLSLYDDAGTMRAALAVRPDQTSALGLFDGRGEVIVSLDHETRGKLVTPNAGAPRAK